jgi:hypothetical protein
MLIRVRGYHSGIKEYLESGQKQDREMQRDEMDERVVLAGDLELTNELIESIDTEAERYLTVTLSFKEDYIEPTVLREIVAEFERYAFSAYRPDEYHMYAEAHLPKIKAYTNRKNGEPVERKPHIHIVIPETNLLSGTRLDPFGLVESNSKFVDAFQEHINHKFGLASPKANRRVEFTDASEMLSRYKGDVFEGSNSDAKARILDAIVTRDIRSYDDFKTLLAEFGETRTRNAGRPNEYENVKLDGAPRGINLKEYVFSREFIELPAERKQEALGAKYTPQYDTAGEPQATPAALIELVREWENVRSKEVKYLNGAFRARYQQMSADEQRQVLAERESGFYQRYDNEVRHDAGTRNGRSSLGRGRADGGLGRGTSWIHAAGQQAVEHGQAQRAERSAGIDHDREHDLAADRPGTPAESPNRMRDLQGFGLDGEHSRSKVLLSDLAPIQLGIDRSSSDDALRWRSAGRTGRGTQSADRGIGSHWRRELATEYARYAQSTAPEQRALNAATAAKLNRSYDQLKGGGKLPPSFDRQHRPESLHRTLKLSATPSLHPKTDVQKPSRGRRSSMSRAQSERLASEFEVGKGAARSRRSRPPGLREEGSLPSTWQRPRRARNTATGRAADTLLDQLERNLHEQRTQRSAGPHSEFQEIRHQLDASRLLASLAHSHGLLIDKYTISRGRDGADRIRCGNRNLNVSDFLTKEMNLPWSEASQILRGAYQAQLSDDPGHMDRRAPQQVLWREYQQYRAEQLAEARNQWLVQGDSERDRKAAIRDEFIRRRSLTQDNPALTPAEKKAAVSIARMQRVEQESVLRESIAGERAALREKTRYRIDDHYREYLTNQAAAGDDRALNELRRMQRVARRIVDADARIEPVRAIPAEANSIVYRGPRVTHEVHVNGDVTYMQDGRSVFDDEGRSLRMWESDDAAIELALRLSQKKFGNVLELTGPEEFRLAAARVAAERKLNVEFSDPQLNEVMDARRAVLAALEKEGRERERAREQAIRQIAKDALKQQQGTPEQGVDRGPDAEPEPGLER